MAKPIIIESQGKVSQFDFSKLSRSKLYGRRQRVALDPSGERCKRAALTADGSLLMRLGELEVLARAGVAVPLVIINDRALGTMKSRQKSRGMTEYELGLHPVDLAAVARSCGLDGIVVESPESFEQALKDSLHAECSTLIDARVDAQAYQDSFGPMVGL